MEGESVEEEGMAVSLPLAFILGEEVFEEVVESEASVCLGERVGVPEVLEGEDDG